MKRTLRICLVMMILPGILWAGNESSRGVDRLPTSGIYAYVADLWVGVRIIDVSDPTNPTEVGFYDTPGDVRDVYVSGNYTYVADGSPGLRVLDVSDPTTPTEVGFYNTPGYAGSVYVSGNYAYVADGNGLCTIDISDPTNPVEVSYFSEHLSMGIHVSGNYVYAGSGTEQGLLIIDISDPTNPTEAGFYHASHWVEASPVSGNYAYLGLVTFKTDQPGIEVPTEPGKDEVFVVVDVSDPAYPFRVSGCDLPSMVFGIDLAGDYAYLAAYEAGLRIIDISDPTNPFEIGCCDTLGNYYYEVFVLGNYTYVADFGGYFRVINTLDPGNPYEVGLIEGIWGAYAVHVVDYELPQVSVIFPNGGEGFTTGDICDITWLAEDNVGVDSISILFSIDAGSSWETIANGEENDSTYSWTIPDTQSDNCLVKIIAYDSSLNTAEDQSDSFFSISLLGIEENSSSPGSSAVLQIVPNPFRGLTEITYIMGQSEGGNRITSGSTSLISYLKIYDVGGRLIKQWDYPAADQSYHAVWDGRNNGGCEIPPGIYLVRFETQDHAVTEKVILLK